MSLYYRGQVSADYGAFEAKQPVLEGLLSVYVCLCIYQADKDTGWEVPPRVSSGRHCKLSN